MPAPALHPERDLAVGFALGRRQVNLVDLGAPTDEPALALPLPVEHEGHAVAFHRNALYVGTGAEKLLVYDLDQPGDGWHEVPLPAERIAKAIDAFLLADEQLIAVDDMIYPHFQFVFDVQDPLRPRLLRTLELGHGTGHVTDAALATTHEVVISHMLGETVAAGFYHRPELRPAFTISQEVYPDFREAELGHSHAAFHRAHEWHQVEAIGNLVLVAAGVDGLGVLDLDHVVPGRRQAFLFFPLHLPAEAEVVAIQALTDGRAFVLAVGLYTPEELAERPQPSCPAHVEYRVFETEALRARLDSLR